MRWKSWREFKNFASMNFWEEDCSKIRTLFVNSRPELRNYRMKSSVWIITIERRDPLFAVTQITSNQCQTRLTSTSEYPDCHIQLWNKLRTIMFVNSFRRSRTTLTDNLFNEIYNKTNPTTRSVRRPRKWFRTWGNVELFELFETDSKTPVQRMPIFLERRHRLLHMRASLERMCSQSRRHPIYMGPSLISRT